MDIAAIEKTAAMAGLAHGGDAPESMLLREHLEAGALLAVSGGPDSMALLALAHHCWIRFGTARPQVFSVDHGLRPESAAECALVARVCEGWGFRHHLVHWQAAVRPGSGVQAAARLERYRRGLAIASAEGLTRLLTAHHRDDQAETVLMRLTRNRGARSLAGIHAQLGRAGDGPIIARPFLDLSKTQLRAIAERFGVPFVDDPSNHDRCFERARVRAQLALQGAGIDELAALAARMARCSAATERSVDCFLRAHARVRHGRIESALAPLLSGRDALSRSVLRRLVMAAAGTTRPPSARSLDNLARELARRGTDRVRRTLAGACVTRASGRLVIEREWGRAGPSDLDWDVGSPVWDGRFRLSGPAAAAAVMGDGGLSVRAFGHTGRGTSFERTLPSLWRHGRCVAVLPLLAAKAPMGTETDLKVECLVENRLFDPYLGGLIDRLRLGSH